MDGFMGFISAAIVIIVNLAWLRGGGMLTRFFRDPHGNRLLNIGFAVLLIVSVAAALIL